MKSWSAQSGTTTAGLVFAPWDLVKRDLIELEATMDVASLCLS